MSKIIQISAVTAGSRYIALHEDGSLSFIIIDGYKNVDGQWLPNMFRSVEIKEVTQP